MGCFGSKEKLSKEDLEFLKTHTRYDEQMIKEWYKGFRVSGAYSVFVFKICFLFSPFCCCFKSKEGELTDTDIVMNTETKTDSA